MNVVAVLVLSLVVSVLVGVLGTLAIIYRRRWMALKKRAEQNLVVDLELATSEQLMAELRNRPRTYLMLTPGGNPDQGVFSISIEVHNMDPVSSCGMLKMAAALTEKELNRQGIQLPEMPPFGNQESDE